MPILRNYDVLEMVRVVGRAFQNEIGEQVRSGAQGKGKEPEERKLSSLIPSLLCAVCFDKFFCAPEVCFWSWLMVFSREV